MEPSRPKSDQTQSLPDELGLGADDPLTAQMVAYLDGELDSQESDELEARLNRDPALRSRVESLRQTWALLDHLPRPEPSPHFTERTLEKIEPAPAAASRTGINKTAVRTLTTAAPKSSSTNARVASAPDATSAGPRRTLHSNWRATLVVSVVILGIATALGYFLRAATVTPTAAESPVNTDPKVEDFHLLRNFRLYQHVNDLKFLKDLDHPDLFGNGSPGS